MQIYRIQSGKQSSESGMFTQFPKALIQKIPLNGHPEANVELSVLREDLSHPFLAGNKWRKLKYNLEAFRLSQKKAIITFGGKYSNHLVACAAAGKIFGIPMIAIMRGEEDVINPNILFLKKCGMRIINITREDYRKREDSSFLDKLSALCSQTFPELKCRPEDFLLVPEGGSNTEGVKGCIEIMDDVPEEITHVCVACGTGTTLAGIASGLAKHQTAIGISVLRAENFLLKSVLSRGADPERTKIIFDYHFGGYAKKTKALEQFCLEFTASTGIPIEPVYTGKLFFAIDDMISKGYFPPGSKILIFHCGGIFDFNKPVDTLSFD